VSYQQRKVQVFALKHGDVVARDIINDYGQLILSSGTRLSQSTIERLKELGILEVWIQQEVEDLPIRQVPVAIADAFRDSVMVVETLFEQARLHDRIDLPSTQETLWTFAQICNMEVNMLNLFINLRTSDEYTFQHSVGVGLLSRKIGEWLGMPEDFCNDLMLAGFLHDIGKSKIDDSILRKPGKLTPEEFETIKHHTTLGYKILINSNIPEHIALGAYGHHERMDGNGYPRGLKGYMIDTISRIIAVADVFNAMTSQRVYRDPVSVYKVLEEIHQNAFSTLDPHISTLLISKMTSYLTGNVVRLNDGSKGVVVFVPVGNPTRPLIRLENETFLDLQIHSDLYIERVLSV
jgi:putative nucleotidyltransferase with HDIG domain